MSALATVLQLLNPSVGANPARTAATSLRLPLQTPITGFGVEDALPGLVFDQPVAIASPPGETNRLFIVEKPGRIVVITNLARPTRTVFLDVTGGTSALNLESGFLGLAFHPGFATNRTFFVFRTLFTSSPAAAGAFHDQISRFEVAPDDPHRALSESETPVLVQLDDNDTHNAGDLHFGPDGYLYVSFGDLGPPPSQASPFTQSIDRHFFGAILRLDVDGRPDHLAPNPHPAVTPHYRIPPDNPFVGATEFQGRPVQPSEVRTEIFALGFRNPWRFWVDPQTGRVYCGDVGNAAIEEVNLVEAGGNYGWPHLEGDRTNSPPSELPPQFNPKAPLVAYAHGNKSNEGNSVIGGRVYRGSALPGQHGRYLFGDHVRGHIWAIDPDQSGGDTPPVRLTADAGLSAFGVDPRDGEILLANFRDGRIRRLVYRPPTESPLPVRLSETGAFADLATLSPSPGIVPFEVAVPFWSDHAIKGRWFALPDTDSMIRFQPLGNWQFPTGMVWIKHFDLELTNGVPSSRRRLETRFLVRNADGVYGVTYRWDDAQQDAYLVEEGGRDEQFVIRAGDTTRLHTWRYPSRAECVTCHSELGGFALGFNTPQLNREMDYGHGPVNQIEALHVAGYVAGLTNSTETLWRLISPRDAQQPLHYRLKSYFAANCVNCHQPGSRAVLGAYWDARISTPLLESSLLQPHLVTPYDPRRSILHFRLAETGISRMPPIGSSVIDTNAAHLVAEWINSLPPPPWRSEDVGAPVRYGGTVARQAIFEVSGAGLGLRGARDEFQFAYTTLTNNGQIIARLLSLQGSSGHAGVVVRQSLAPGAAGAAILVSTEGRVQARFRASDNALTRTLGDAPVTLPCWLRVSREGNRVMALYRPEGGAWQKLGDMELALPSGAYGGMAVSSEAPYDFQTATFEGVDVMSLALDAPAPDTRVTLPAELTLRATLRHLQSHDFAVSFHAGSNTLGVATSPPYAVVWSNILAGSHEVTARLLDPSGAEVTSAPVRLHADLPPAAAAVLGRDNLTAGDWIERYGGLGYAVAGIGTNLPEARLSLDAGVQTWAVNTSSRRAPRHPDGGRIAAAWTNDTEIVVDLDLNRGLTRRVSLYFLEWSSFGSAQEVEVLDGVSGASLARAEFRAFRNGAYLNLAVRGAVRIRVRSLTGAVAMLSGLFMDEYSHRPPMVVLEEPVGPISLEAPASIDMVAAVTPGDGASVAVEFYANENLVGRVAAAPYRLTLTQLLAGEYELFARAVDDLGFGEQTAPVTAHVGLPPAEVRFLGVDDLSRGDWIGRYGSQGAQLATLPGVLPPWLQLDSNTNRLHLWAWPTFDPGALETEDEGPRLAATWVDAEKLTFDLAVLDGRARQLGLYVLDWDSGARHQRIDFLDAATDQILDTREVRDFSGGRHLLYRVKGRVRLRITRLQSNAVLSGFFFDPVPAPFREWQMESFPEQWLDDTVAGSTRDPDLDRFVNVVEYALGLNPSRAEAQAFSRVLMTGDRLELSFRRITGASGVGVTLEVSEDLQSWREVAEEVEVVSITPEGRYEVVTARSAGAAPAVRFFRLKVATDAAALTP